MNRHTNEQCSKEREDIGLQESHEELQQTNRYRTEDTGPRHAHGQRMQISFRLKNNDSDKSNENPLHQVAGKHVRQ